MKDKISRVFQKVAGLKEVQLEFPENEGFGDYSTNVALVLAKKEGKNPKEYASDLVDKLKGDKGLSQIVSRVEVAGPGFINFFLSKKALLDALSEVVEKKEIYGKGEYLAGQKIMVEFAHPNTHKPFHIGHLRNITTGEAICRILEAVQAKVVRVNYQGDVGLHIAKALWGIGKLGFKDPKEVKARMEFLGKAYVEGNKAYEEDKRTVKEGIEELNKALYEGTDKELINLYQTTRKWSLEYFDTIYKRVYTKFDRLYFESEVAAVGKKLALDALQKNILEKSQGAIIYAGEKKGLHNRVFITKLGLPTYEAKDLGLARLQFSEFDPDKIIHVVGPEQSDYFKVLFEVLAQLNPRTKDKELHIPYGWVRLKKGKMSSRLGNVVLGEWLLDEVKERIKTKYDTQEKTAEEIAVGAVKYSFLKVGLSQDIAFDIEESISLEGNSGPYLQYTVARTNSVLAKVKTQNSNVKTNNITMEQFNNEELAVLRALVRFSDVVVDTARLYAPNLLCNYLFDLAQKYNNFYNQHRIIGSENEDFRLRLTLGVGKVLKNGLNILGIKSPEKM